jgi:hypothetical protein
MSSRPAAPGVPLPPPAAFGDLVQAQTVRWRKMIEVAKVTGE